MTQIIQLHDRSHAEVRALLATGAVAYLLVNPVEYHGPHLSLRNDHLVSLGFARDLHRALDEDAPLVLAAPIEAGVEPCMGPGTCEVPFASVRRMVVEACEALAALGARRVVLMTFHGSPMHGVALAAGVRALAARGVRALDPLALVVREQVALSEQSPDERASERSVAAPFLAAFDHIDDADERRAMLQGMPYDFHAGFLETSLALHYAPASVSPVYTRLPPCPAWPEDKVMAAAARAADAAGRRELAAELRFAAAGRGWGSLRPFPGYTGRPHRATPGAGEVFARAITARYAECARAVFAGAEPPRPIMAWLEALTLGGRLPGLRVPREAVATWRDLGLSE